MNSMTYKGYTARVEFDERDDIFVGRVLGVRDIISFHADSVAELRAEFAAAVEDYLADCAEQGLSPEKPASGKSDAAHSSRSACCRDHCCPIRRQESEPVG
jgi:predicted HicB family RNase H-like nuclease